MSRVSVSIEGSVGRFDPVLPLRRASQSASRLAFATALGMLGQHVVTGQLLSGLRVESGDFGFTLSNPVRHAWFLEYGTRPHRISPKRGKYLRFTGSSGVPVFARGINHPGTRPTPIMETSVLGNAPVFARMYSEEVWKEMKRV